ncbi:nitroreductase [Methanogenium sp. S4BF]|uniref:nitroreductase n=1 Tax=Methanogenium sp. S4BF TaxID=1789226 RepID=UPI002415F504|nr:nitroreductase [Methanogenium sp. S4BF]WFN34532.1 nitroreductase [Methanogenium sp. S4BF]
MEKSSSNQYNGFRSLVIAATIIMMIAISITPAAALTLGCVDTFIDVANDAGVKYNYDGDAYDGPNNTYYIKFEGGGLNALHITTDTSVPAGQVTSSQSATGSFNISDTGGRGYDDNLILLFAAKTPVSEDFSLNIKSSGYTWTPTGEMPTSYNYVNNAVNETFTYDDLIYGPQDYRPAGYNLFESYPIYYGQDMGQTENFTMMFIDLNVGVIGNSNGMGKVEYTLENFSGFAAFNAYAWCIDSNQGEGISWTNRVDSLIGSSGYTVTLP